LRAIETRGARFFGELHLNFPFEENVKVVDGVAFAADYFAGGHAEVFHAFRQPGQIFRRKILKDRVGLEVGDVAFDLRGVARAGHSYTVPRYWCTNCTAFAPSPTRKRHA
jgi:hypothetical protein